MSRRFKPLFCLSSFLLSCVFLIAPALADDIGAPVNAAAVVQAIRDNTTKLGNIYTANTNTITDKMDGIASDLALSISTAFQDESEPRPDRYIQSTLEGMPSALVLLDATQSSLLTNRLRELNLMSPVPVNNLGVSTTTKANYLIDPQQNYDASQNSTTTTPPTGNTINAEIFDIFMRYFCDPDGRSGTLGTVLTQKGHLIESLRYPGKYLACGSVILDNGDIVTTGVSSRDGTLGKELDSSERAALAASVASAAATGNVDTTSLLKLVKEQNRDDIKNLPLKPGKLFFDTSTTVPVLPDKNDPNATNTNPLAPVYYGAFAEALQFLVGPPDDLTDLPAVTSDPMGGGQATFIKAQGRIARKMLASYPFVLLFSERLGTLDAATAQTMSDMLVDKIGNAMGNGDAALYNKIISFKSRKNMSLAEYMDIVMYQVPMSPGYLMRINNLDLENLEREKVWLTAQQIVLNYERNRWLEILAALEAVKPETAEK